MTKIISKQEQGFSDRFNQLLDMADFPKQNEGRYTEGAKRFGHKSHLTFRSWCTENKKPRTYEILLEVVISLLSDIQADYDPHSIIAWLYGGDAVKNPFNNTDTDFSLKLDIFLLVTELSDKEKTELTKLELQNITKKIYGFLVKQRRKGLKIEPVESNRDAINLINFCLDELND